MLSKFLKNGGLKKTFHTVNHVLIIANTSYLTYKCIKVGFNDLTAWHALCTVFGYQFLMAQGILTFNPSNMLMANIRRPAKIRIHQVLQAAGATLAIAGIITQFVNKNMHDISHLGSPHSFWGAISATSLLLSTSSGMTLIYGGPIKKMFKAPSIRKFHNVVTVVAFSSGMLAMISGYLIQKWMIKNDPENMRFLLAASTAATLLITIANPMRSAFGRKIM